MEHRTTCIHKTNKFCTFTIISHCNTSCNGFVYFSTSSLAPMLLSLFSLSFSLSFFLDFDCSNHFHIKCHSKCVKIFMDSVRWMHFRCSTINALHNTINKIHFEINNLNNLMCVLCFSSWFRISFYRTRVNCTKSMCNGSPFGKM